MECIRRPHLANIGKRSGGQLESFSQRLEQTRSDTRNLTAPNVGSVSIEEQGWVGRTPTSLAEGRFFDAPYLPVLTFAFSARTPLKVAIVHEWFSTYAGSERVVEQLLGVVPQADLFALVDFLADNEREFIGNRPVTTSMIQRMPWAKKRFRAYLPLMPLAVEQLDVSGYDVVISSNHAVAKGVIIGPDQRHISYVHSPIRYAWDLQHQYLKEEGLTGLRGFAARLILHYLRLWDQSTASRVNTFVANSKYIARRIRNCYQRDAEVIYPPVDVDAFELHETKEDFYLTASRLVPYKRMPLIAEAFSAMPNRKLVVVGDRLRLRQGQSRRWTECRSTRLSIDGHASRPDAASEGLRLRRRGRLWHHPRRSNGLRHARDRLRPRWRYRKCHRQPERIVLRKTNAPIDR